MDPSTSGTYEGQLHALFNTADVNQTGTLDFEGLSQLCSSLHLEERGNELINKLLNDKNLVTFHEFKEALIKLLREASNEDRSVNTSGVGDSSESETSPKYKYPKKYNRRAQRKDLSPEERPSDDSKVQRSSSYNDVHPLKKRKGNQLKRCTSFPDSAEFKRLPEGEESEFLKFITTAYDGSPIIDSDVIVQIWENAGISSALNLLQDLGFNANQVNINELAIVLEDELQNMSGNHQQIIFTSNPHLALLQASRVLYQSEVKCLKSAMEHLNAERDKLKADVNDANYRADILTQEVDDNHAKIEKATNEKVKLLEQRHANIVRDLTEQLTGEREQATFLNMKLEKRTAALENEVIKLKLEIERVEQDNTAIEKENQSLVEQVSELEQNYTQLAQNLSTLEAEKQNHFDVEGSREREQIITYEEKIALLQTENVSLKDKNDELCMELESISSQLSAVRFKTNTSTPLVDKYEMSEASTSAIFDGTTTPKTSKLQAARVKSALKVDGLQIMAYADLGADEYDYGNSSVSIQSSDGSADEDLSKLQARVAYLEKLLGNYGHDLSTDPVLNQQWVSYAS